jgi:restriction system protein
MVVTREDLPNYRELIYPTLRAVKTLGGTGQAREITAQVIADIGATERQMEVTYDNRPKSVLVDRIDWARSYAYLGLLLERPRRGLFALSPLGRQMLEKCEEEALEEIREIDRKVRASRRANAAAARKDNELGHNVDEEMADTVEEESATANWRDVLLSRLHRLSPAGFEAFVIYLLKTYGMELTRVGGTGDEGIDGIGLAPLSPVLSTRVAVQAKRYDPSTAIGREVVALFQRDAAAAGAERAILVTLGRFSPAARKAATVATPTVNLIDGDRLCDLVEEQETGLKKVPQIVEAWFDRFD